MHGRIAPIVLLGALPLAPALAHHSRAIFSDDVISFQGEIVRFDWANPHSYIYVKAQDATGATVQWEIETQSTPGLARRGWTQDSLKPGELVTVHARPHRNPSLHAAFAQEFIKEDGAILASIGATSSTPDSPPRAQSLWGVWGVVTARGRGFGKGPDLSLPLTEKGRAAAAHFDERDDPLIECIPLTAPEGMSSEYLHAIEQSGTNVLLRDEFWEVSRPVYMDGRAHPPADQRFQQGHSTGRWEGDTLVVETTNFTDNVWGTARGIPSGAQKRVVERYRLTDDGATVTIDFTLADPEYLTEPIAGSEKWRYVPSLELLSNKCDLEIAHRYLRTN